MATIPPLFLLLPLLLLLPPPPTTAIGVNYGTLSTTLPPPSTVAQFLQSHTKITQIKLFNTDPTLLHSFSNTSIPISVTIPNSDIPSFTNPFTARRYINTFIKPFHTQIRYICVGTEVLHWGPQSIVDTLVPAMRVIHSTLVKLGLDQIKVSTPHSLSILAESTPPSNASFRKGWDVGNLGPVLRFHRRTKSGFMVNPYTYYAYSPEKESYCLFRPNRGLFDKATGKRYTNMFDQLLDAVYVSMKKLGYPDVEIIVAETGWPSGGDPQNTHANPRNAAAYNRGVIKKVSSGVGTPLMPGQKFETYIFSLFNEDLKGPSLDEKNFGLFRTDLSPVYDIGIMREPQSTGSSPKSPAPSKPSPSSGKRWCVPKPDATDVALQANIDYICSNGLDCSPTQPGGPCFEPNTVRAHASFLMNSYYQEKGRHDLDCDFAHTGIIASTDPSNGQCKYIS